MSGAPYPPEGWWEHEDPEEASFLRRYGPWAPLTPTEVAAELAGFDRPWWIVGGWSIEAFTGVAREHEDVDVSILTCDLPALRDHVGDRWHLWVNHGGTLRLLEDRNPEPFDPADQIWWRRDALSPWVIDLPLTPDADGAWTDKRMPSHTAPVQEVTWVAADGLCYLDPEITLFFKAKLDRPKDRGDLAVTLPLLDGVRRDWLRGAIEQTLPGHPWLALMDE